MKVDHFIVFVGASASLATQLSSLEKRISKSRVIAPAMKKKYIGITEEAIRLASTELYYAFEKELSPSQQARLYLWMYEPTTIKQLESIWGEFGHSCWVETIPRIYVHKNKDTKIYIDNRIKIIRQMLHEISNATYVQRKSSPLSLPLRNFNSRITIRLKSYWYNNLDKFQISKEIRSLKAQYKQVKIKNRGYKDNNSLIFSPANDNECHGKPHPTGDSKSKIFLCGRFRYGVSLFPGFHFDVSSENSSTINCHLRTASGDIINYASAKKRYVNIFPNDYILPKIKSGV